MLTRIALAALCTFVLASGGARASDTNATIANTGVQKAYVTLVVDGIGFGAAVIAIEGSDVFVTLADAARAAVPLAAAGTRTIGGVPYVSLASLAPRATFRLDDASLTLSISIRPALLGTTRYTAQPDAARVDAANRPPSAFLNYDLSAQSAGNASGFFETGLSSHDSMFYASEALQTGGPSQRGQTYFAHDDVAHLRREVVGDAVAGEGDDLLGEVDVLGVGVQREFALDPYLAHFPSPSVAGLLATPGTADVYVNGLLARSVPLSPGGYDLSNIPVATGLSDVSIVIRDADGNVRTYRESYFGSDSLLRKGLTDYSYGAGFLRSPDDLGYGNPALAASYRIGASDTVTLGGRAALAAGRSEFEGESDVLLGAALVHVGEAFARVGPSSGTATDAGFAYTGRTNGISLAATLRAQTFAAFDADAVPVEPAHFEVEGSASQQLARRTSISASFFRQTFRDLAPETTSLVTLSQELRRANLIATFAQSRSGSAARTNSIGVSLTTQLGARGSLSVGQTVGANAQNELAYQLAPPSNDAGLGYGIHRTSGQNSSTLAMVQEHSPIADVDVYAQSSDGAGPQGTISVAGAAVLVAGHLLPARPVSASFTLVESGNVGNVPVTVDGRPVGKTNDSGLLVVTSVGPYASNRIELDDAAMPLGVEVAHGEQYVSPGFRGGSVAAFGVERIAYYVGTIVVGNDRAPAVDGTLDLVRGSLHLRTVLDESGAYYFENLAPGRYRATVRLRGTPCAFDFDVPSASGVANDLGARACVP